MTETLSFIFLIESIVPKLGATYTIITLVPSIESLKQQYDLVLDLHH